MIEGTDVALANDLRPGFTYQDENWEERGACRSVSPDLFFPQKGGDGGRKAKAICASCPVLQQCRERILVTEPSGKNLRHGIWGGTTPTERAALVRAARRAASAPV